LVRTSKKASAKEKREPTSRSVEQVAADPKGLIARRKEFRLVEGTVKVPTVSQKTQAAIAANDGQVSGWHWPLLTLKRA
jgi:hypothetical protein